MKGSVMTTIFESQDGFYHAEFFLPATGQSWRIQASLEPDHWHFTVYDDGPPATRDEFDCRIPDFNEALAWLWKEIL